MAKEVSQEQIRQVVKERYAKAARQVRAGGGGSCCSGPIASQSRLYEISQLKEIPQTAALASLGCGNPTLLAELRPGEVVLDLGSGGGIDVLLSARRVGPEGKVYGLDMTDEMLELARENAARAGVSNVEFLKGQIEAIPLPDESVDVIISNCVINLSADKDAVFSEAFRVLKPGGRFAVADIVVRGGQLPDPVRRMMSLWAGCVAGALSEEEYVTKMEKAGFEEIGLETLKVYDLEDVPEEMRCCFPEGLTLPPGVEVISAFVRASKGGGAAGGRSSTAISIRLGTEARVKVPASSCCGTADSGSGGCCGETVKRYFQRVAAQWDRMREGYFTEAVRDAAIARARLGRDHVVADVGTGTGFMLQAVAPTVRLAYGFDSSPEMLDVARKNLAGVANVELKISEGSSLPLPDAALDAVFANMYLHHAPDPQTAIAEMVRVLKPGGRLVITDLDRHEEEWMRAEMADLWLGFEREQVESWFSSAGLAEVVVEAAGCSCCGTSASGDEASIGVFVASGSKPVLQ